MLAQTSSSSSSSPYWGLYDNLVPCLQNRPFMSGPGPIVSLIAVYLVTIYYVGPRFMANRKAFELRGVILTYDAVQVVFNVGLLAYGYIGMIMDGHKTCMCLPSTEQTAAGTYIYFLNKIFDLVETLLFVLRKKFGQISVLHVYHHVTICLGSYLSLLIEPGGHSSFLGYANLFVHANMYLYYFVSAYDPENRKRYERFKIHLTQMQIVQFLLNIVHFSIPLLVPTCKYSHSVSWLVLATNALVTVMFTQFYLKTYGWRLK